MIMYNGEITLPGSPNRFQVDQYCLLRCPCTIAHNALLGFDAERTWRFPSPNASSPLSLNLDDNFTDCRDCENAQSAADSSSRLSHKDPGLLLVFLAGRRAQVGLYRGVCVKSVEHRRRSDCSINISQRYKTIRRTLVLERCTFKFSPFGHYIQHVRLERSAKWHRLFPLRPIAICETGCVVSSCFRHVLRRARISTDDGLCSNPGIFRFGALRMQNA